MQEFNVGRVIIFFYSYSIQSNYILIDKMPIGIEYIGIRKITSGNGN